MAHPVPFLILLACTIVTWIDHAHGRCLLVIAVIAILIGAGLLRHEVREARHHHGR